MYWPHTANQLCTKQPANNKQTKIYVAHSLLNTLPSSATIRCNNSRTTIAGWLETARGEHSMIDPIDKMVQCVLWFDEGRYVCTSNSRTSWQWPNWVAVDGLQQKWMGRIFSMPTRVCLISTCGATCSELDWTCVYGRVNREKWVSVHCAGWCALHYELHRFALWSADSRRNQSNSKTQSVKLQ